MFCRRELVKKNSIVVKLMSPKVLLFYIICRDEDATVIQTKHWSGATSYTPQGGGEENKTRYIQNNTNKSIYYRLPSSAGLDKAKKY